MASPQTENGYTRIANELLEAFIYASFTEYQRKVVLYIWRKTYGFGKKGDWIANSQFVVGTGIAKGHVSRTVKELEIARVVTRRGNYLSVNKDFTQWLKVTRRGNSSYSTGTQESYPSGQQSYPDGQQKLPRRELQKKKETIQKKLPAKAGTNDMKKYSETQHSDAYEKVINLETGETTESISTTSRGKDMDALIAFAQAQRPKKFMNLGKQRKAIASMFDNGFTPRQIGERYTRMSSEQYWKDKGFDFLDVLNSFDKKSI